LFITRLRALSIASVSILPCNRAMRRPMRPRSSFSVYLPRTRQRIAAGKRLLFKVSFAEKANENVGTLGVSLAREEILLRDHQLALLSRRSLFPILDTG